jgi:N-acetylglucosaminyldiphosphoundecaprenol N-acetyl-beta-D-mannosaminyltransferase
MPLRVHAWPDSRSRAVVFNTEAAYFFLTSHTYRADAIGANDIYCDGAGLQLYIGLRFGRRVRRRHGPDLLREYLLTRTQARVHFVGGSNAAHSGLQERFPAFFTRNEVTIDTRTLEEHHFAERAAVLAARPVDDVLIFLGLARQERFQHRLHEAGFAGSSIGLGAAIDFVSGSKIRAGRAWQAFGLEWLPRLMREPRMLPRVQRSFALFALLGARENQELRGYLFGTPSK